MMRGPLSGDRAAHGRCHGAKEYSLRFFPYITRRQLPHSAVMCEHVQCTLLYSSWIWWCPRKCVCSVKSLQPRLIGLRGNPASLALRQAPNQLKHTEVQYHIYQFFKVGSGNRTLSIASIIFLRRYSQYLGELSHGEDQADNLPQIWIFLA